MSLIDLATFDAIATRVTTPKHGFVGSLHFAFSVVGDAVTLAKRFPFFRSFAFASGEKMSDNS